MTDDRKRYSCKCPTCGAEFWVCKSIFQEAFGQDELGSGNCPECKTHHNLTFDRDTEQMIATPYEQWLSERTVAGEAVRC